MSDAPHDPDAAYPDLPREVVEPFARHDPVIERMLRDGTPLNRSAYLNRVWRGAVPDEWTYEHEHEVPACFHDPHAVTPR